MPRPERVLTDKEKDSVEVWAVNLTTEQIADLLHIDRATFWRIMDRDPEVMRRYKAGVAKGMQTVTNTLMDQIGEGNTAAMIFWLKTRGKWSEKSALELTGADGGAIVTKVVREVIDKEKKDG